MSYGFEWMPAVVLVGALVLLAAPGVAVIGLAVLAVAALTALIALAGVVLASPYLLARTLRRRLAERRPGPHGAVQIPAAFAKPS